jgi:NAD(P)-dependent dehydrogenase (short-subunit alcohol dehydrogenase family)
VLRLDVTDDFRVIQEVAREAIAIYGRVDVLLNNAGVSIFGTVEEVGYDTAVRAQLGDTQANIYSIAPLVS